MPASPTFSSSLPDDSGHISAAAACASAALNPFGRVDLKLFANLFGRQGVPFRLIYRLYLPLLYLLLNIFPGHMR